MLFMHNETASRVMLFPSAPYVYTPVPLSLEVINVTCYV